MGASRHAGVPCARRTIFTAFRGAAEDLWGEAGLASLAAGLPPDAREETLGSVLLVDEWLPEAYVLAWYEAAWSGPAGRSDAQYCRFLDRMMDLGFGRVRKFLLAIITPEGMAKKAAELWRHDHTTGELSATTVGREATLTLRQHVYCTTPLARRSIAEIYRYAMSLTRAAGVTATHVLEADGSLQVKIRWT
jgi:hypothetical protein